MQQLVPSDVNDRRPAYSLAQPNGSQPLATVASAMKPLQGGLDRTRITSSLPPYPGGNLKGRTPRYSASHSGLVKQLPQTPSKSTLAVPELSLLRLEHNVGSKASSSTCPRTPPGSLQRAPSHWHPVESRMSGRSLSSSASLPHSTPQVVREASSPNMTGGRSVSPLTKPRREQTQPMSLSLQQLGESDQEIVSRLRSAEVSKAIAAAKNALAAVQVEATPPSASAISQSGTSPSSGAATANEPHGPSRALHSHFSALSFVAAAEGSSDLGAVSLNRQDKKAVVAKLQKKGEESAISRNLATLSEASTISGSSTSAVAVPSSNEDSCCHEQMPGTSPSNATSENLQPPYPSDGRAVALASAQEFNEEAAKANMALQRSSSSSADTSKEADQIEHLRVQGTETQLHDMMKAFQAELMSSLRAEKHERESLALAVRGLGKRLDDGLTSMSEVAAARSETEGATDAVLSAMRHCIDELSIQCAWPRASASDADPSQAPTLSEAVRQQQLQLRQLSEMQAALQAQHEEQRRQAGMMTSWMKQHQEHLDEGMQAVTAAIADFPVRQETMGASIFALQHRVAEVAASCTDSKEKDLSISTATATQLATLQEQVQQMNARQHQQDTDLKAVASALRELGEAAASSSATVASAATTAEAAASANAGLQSLKSEVTTIANAVNILCERVNSMSVKDQQRDLQTEIGAIANVVSQLSERVDHLSGDNAPRIAEVRSAETPEALRQKLAALVGDVRRVHEETREAKPSHTNFDEHGQGPQRAMSLPMAAVPTLSLPEASSRKAPSPRRWMAEPLSVSVGRVDTMQVAPSDGSGAADRILARTRGATVRQ